MYKTKKKTLIIPNLIWILCLVTTIVFIFSKKTGLINPENWSIPLGYQGDYLFGLANAKAYMDGDISLFFQKWVHHLNAPFVANWNDWPITEDIIFASIGWLGRWIGLFDAANLILLSCHIFAGLSFWFVSRVLNIRYEYAFLCAIAYAFSSYSYFRGFAHINLTMYWHIPLLILTSWWVFENNSIALSGKRKFVSLFTSISAGALSPYYSWMYIQFLGFAILKHIICKNFKAALIPSILGLITFLFFLLFNLDTLTYQFLNGPNTDALVRNISGLELYGLKLPDLFLPVVHRWTSLNEFTKIHYYSDTFIKGEIGSTYLGFIGIIGFFWLMLYGLNKLFKNEVNYIPTSWWQMIWILLYSLVGGFNLLLGSFGFVLFRGTNRYSIFILTLSLLFLAQRLSTKFPSRIWRLLAILLIPIILWDQLPNDFNPSLFKTTVIDKVKSDHIFTTSVEKQLPLNSMIFQLPLSGYPEYPAIEKMTTYEHFRPYLHTSSLRYSYGTDKGRDDDDWQSTIINAPPSEMIYQLEKLGFSAIIINKKGYTDHAEQLIKDITLLGHSIISDSQDLIAFKLTPSINPELPLLIVFSDGWSGPEKEHRWAIDKSAKINIKNFSSMQKKYIISFNLSAIQLQKIDITFNKIKSKSIIVTPGKLSAPVEIVVDLPMGKSDLEIFSDAIPKLPDNGDPRKLVFDISSFKITNLPSAKANF